MGIVEDKHDWDIMCLSPDFCSAICMNCDAVLETGKEPPSEVCPKTLKTE